MASVFLSHSHADKPFARRLTKDLRAAGHVVWIVERGIEVDDSLIEKIRAGIDHVDYVLALISKTSIQSEWARRELDVASNKEIESKKVIVMPALLHDVEPPGFLKGNCSQISEPKTYTGQV